MIQWDTSQWTFPHGTHPCVILSRTGRCQNPAFDTVNVLACQSQRAQRPANDLESLLDLEDGMDWPTIVRVDFVWTVLKSELTRRRGNVTPERRRDLGAKMIRALGLYLP